MGLAGSCHMKNRTAERNPVPSLTVYNWTVQSTWLGGNGVGAGTGSVLFSNMVYLSNVAPYRVGVDSAMVCGYIALVMLILLNQ